ncbi:efflux RND transporter periplasmic adaptor subunit [Persicitalea jodogahamensis]|uniref:MexH family multidrug efflux RND transporter periplasmic adaptor subunit n=1 Tax=Persicitalea jodogahamensis TaxID=402147 RepID=A0A8J3D274_9BACT|nr:efflux RND transporter periplasmic adaptor subunit [Persicitalea jodogahamensis]GHB56574.1 MexH family multidrug efflux RND transporter periplasmic adaptor subunit [Persicitalea jodogahamensis]
MRPILILGGIILALVFGKLFLFPKSDDEADGRGKSGTATPKGGKAGGGAVPVEVYLAKMEKIDNILYAPGTVVPNEEVELKAEIAGRLIQLNLREGAPVKKGQLIAKINDNELKAQLAKLEYNATLTRNREERQKKLLKIEAISQEEYEIAMNNVSTSQADRDLIMAQLEKTEIRAPFSGTIGLKNISEGAYLSPGTSVVTLVQTNPVKVDFTIPERYAREIRLGSTVQLGLDGDAVRYPARVVALDPKVDENLRTQRVRAILPNPGRLFVPGMFVKVQVDLSDNSTAIMIPTDAIVPVLKGKKVFVVKNGKAREVMVTTGLRTDQKIQITEGLATGDSLIVTGIMALKPDVSVKVK